MTTRTKKPPSSHLLWQGTRAVVAYGLMIGWVVAVGWLTSRGLTFAPTEMVAGPAYWRTDGEGTDTTILYEAKTAGIRFIAWDARCPVTMRLNPWDGAEAGDERLLGTARRASFAYWMPAGSYFFDATASCPWEVSVRSLAGR